jgi:hypothetical protein
LVIKGDNDNEDIQIGVVSWGYECAGTLPGIYSRLSYLPTYNFIEQQVCINSDTPPDYMDCDTWSTVAESNLSTEAPTKSPTVITTFMPTSITSIESEEPTSERLKEALADTKFLYDSDLTLKTTGILEENENIEDVEQPTTPDMSTETLSEMSSAPYPVSSARTDVFILTVFNAFLTYILS